MDASRLHHFPSGRSRVKEGAEQRSERADCNSAEEALGFSEESCDVNHPGAKCNGAERTERSGGLHKPSAEDWRNPLRRRDRGSARTRDVSCVKLFLHGRGPTACGHRQAHPGGAHPAVVAWLVRGHSVLSGLETRVFGLESIVSDSAFAVAESIALESFSGKGRDFIGRVLFRRRIICSPALDAWFTGSQVVEG